MLAGFGISGALWAMAALGLLSTLTFVAIAMLPPAAAEKRSRMSGKATQTGARITDRGG